MLRKSLEQCGKCLLVELGYCMLHPFYVILPGILRHSTRIANGMSTIHVSMVSCSVEHP